MIVYRQNTIRQQAPTAKPEPVKVIKRKDETRDDAIRRMWPTHNGEEIAASLGYALAASVHKRAKALGLPSKRANQRANTQAALDKLRAAVAAGAGAGRFTAGRTSGTIFKFGAKNAAKK